MKGQIGVVFQGKSIGDVKSAMQLYKSADMKIKNLHCRKPNLVYYLICENCPSGVTPHYTGSSVGFPARFSKHKNDMIKGVGKCCGFCAHWKTHHKNNYSDLSHLKIYFLDSCENPGSKEEGYPVLRHLEDQWMVQMGSLGAIDPHQGCNKKDDAKADAWKT